MDFHPPLAAHVRDTLIAAGVAAGRVERGLIFPAKLPALPVASVYMRNDKMAPAGDPRTGEPEYRHTATVVIEIFAADTTTEAIEDLLAAENQKAFQALTDALNQGSPAEAEGFGAVTIEYKVPEEGDEVVGGTRMQIEYLTSTCWTHAPTDPFEGADVRSDEPALDEFGATANPEQEE